MLNPESIRARIEEAYNTGNSMLLWETLRNPANKVSRQAMRDIDPSAPLTLSSMARWKAWLDLKFPDLQGKIDALAEKRQKDWDDWKAKNELRYIEYTAKSGNRYQRENMVYNHAYDFVNSLLADGFIPQKYGIGNVRFIRSDNIFVGPFRNKHINAAITLITMEKEKKEDTQTCG